MTWRMHRHQVECRPAWHQAQLTARSGDPDPAAQMLSYHESRRECGVPFSPLGNVRACPLIRAVRSASTTACKRQSSSLNMRKTSVESVTRGIYGIV